MSNTFGERFKLTTYGESHGLAVGAVIDGCPSGLTIDEDAIRCDLARRRQGAPRQEEDEVEWLSGIRNDASGMTTLGSSIAFLVRNKNTRSEDYAPLEHLFRPGHADYTYYKKYGLREHRGGGRASARETVARVVAGSIAKQLLRGVEIHAHCSDEHGMMGDEHDTYGGIVSCRITGLPAGVGDPVFGKLNARLASAMMSIPSAIGFEMGIGFKAAEMRGSEYIDRWKCVNESKSQKDKESKSSENNYNTITNHCGGVQGGISNGMPIEFRVAFHPVATLPQPVECLHEDGHLESITVRGRHDRCHVERAAVVVEAMAALTIVDYVL